ncbi:MAG TPA: YciI family protein [Gemmatimonadales bacterium]|jgi:hypothetical protein
MRYLSLIKGSENQGAPPPAFMPAMEKWLAETMADGSLVQTGGLARTTSAIRVRSEAGKVTVIDGPYAEAKEVVGGYAVIEAATREAAIESARRFMQIHADLWPEWRGECEVRAIDFIAP